MSNSTLEQEYVNIAGYRFVALYDTIMIKMRLSEAVAALDLRGSVILSPEGINIYLSGLRADINRFMAVIAQDSRFADLAFKESYSKTHSYHRFRIKLKTHVVPSSIEVNPAQATVPNISPQELKRWLDEGLDFTLVDTRNYYETEAGLFDRAIDLQMSVFQELPEKLNALPPETKNKPLVMFCTGGIRCEKGGPIAEAVGFKEVYQLEGGILNYFKECGGSHYQGDCYVFDDRVALTPSLEVSGLAQCQICQHILSVEDQVSTNYVPGVSCSKCVSLNARPPKDQRAFLAESR